MTEHSASSSAESTRRNRRLAESFSAHQFKDTYGSLSAAVRWVLPGQATIEGEDAVVRACQASHTEMAALAHTSFTRFVSIADDRAAAVDAIGRYVTKDGAVSVVSSSDIYEFDDKGLIATITSYAVELEESSPE